MKIREIERTTTGAEPRLAQVCAWCVHEGLAVEPPGQVSHGICPAHREQWLAKMKSAIRRKRAPVDGEQIDWINAGAAYSDADPGL